MDARSVGSSFACGPYVEDWVAADRRFKTPLGWVRDDSMEFGRARKYALRLIVGVATALVFGWLDQRRAGHGWNWVLMAFIVAVAVVPVRWFASEKRTA